LRNIFVVGWERVSGQAKRADPEFSSNIDLAVKIAKISATSRLNGTQGPFEEVKIDVKRKHLPVRVQDGPTRWLTRHGFVEYGWQVFTSFERSIEG
jgi:hypothetical protein